MSHLHPEEGFLHIFWKGPQNTNSETFCFYLGSWTEKKDRKQARKYRRLPLIKSCSPPRPSKVFYKSKYIGTKLDPHII